MTNLSELNSSYDYNKSYFHESYYDDYYISELSFNITEIVLSLSGLVLNTSLIFVLILLEGSLKTHLKFVMSLAISDFLIALLQFVSVFYDIPMVVKTYGILSSPSFIRVAFALLYVMAQYAGLGTMLAISVDILIKIRKPLRYKILMSKRRGNIIIICLWFLTPVAFICISFSLLPFILDHSVDLAVPLVALFLASGLFFALCVLCFIVFIILYILIICSIRNFANRCVSRRRTSIKKAAVTFLFVLLTYVICLLPMIWLLVPILVFRGSHSHLLVRLVTSLYIVNTVCDPIIYTLRIPEIRAKYWTIYRKMCQRGHSESAV